jgi:hypothetical protein
LQRTWTRVIVTIMMRRITRIGLAGMLLASACADSKKDTPGSGEPAQPSTAAGSTAAGTTASPSGSAAGGAETAPSAPATPRSLAPLEPSPGGHEGAHRWSHAIGGLATELARDVAVDAQGRVAVAGYFEGSADFGGTQKDTKTAPQKDAAKDTRTGNQKATRADAPKDTRADTGTDPGSGARRDAKKIDAFVSTYAADGTLLWSLQFGGDGEDAVHAVAFDGAGNAVIAGLFTGSMVLGEIELAGAGSDDAFIAKLDAQGKPLWARVLGGRDSDAAHDLAVDTDGSIYVTGSFMSDMPVDDKTTLRSKGNEDVFLLELGPDGDVVWGQAFGNRSRDFGQRVALDSAGNVVLLAEFTDEVAFGGPALVSEGNRDLAVVKLTSTGGHLWSKRFGSPFNEYGLGLAVDPAGNVALTGSFDNEIDFGGGKLVSAGESDVYVARLGPDGAHLWSQRYGSKREDIGHGIATDRYGNLAITGWFWGEVDFGGGALRAEGMNKDGFLLKLSADAKHLWSRRFGAKDHDQGRGVAMTAEGDVAMIAIFRFRVDLGGNVLESARAPEDKAPPPDVLIAAFGR